MKKYIYVILIFGLAISHNHIFAENNSDSGYASEQALNEYELSELVDELANEAQIKIMNKLDANLTKKLNQKIFYDQEELKTDLFQTTF